MDKIFLEVVRPKKQIIDTYIKVEGSQCGGTLHNMVKEDSSQVIFELLYKNR